VINSFKNQGTPIDILQARFNLSCIPFLLKRVQIGNEINDGLLWPTGQISKNGFNPASQLLHSAASAGRQSSVPKIMVHLADGWDSGSQSWWWKGIQYQGAFSLSDVDLVGVSYYPFYNTKATLSSLKSSLTALVGQINKDIIVAETDWPVACSGGPTMSETSIAISASGQQTWITDIKNVLTSLPSGRGVGIRE
jgi:arabinogalactan endo-1,4-beta-galactosidase